MMAKLTADQIQVKTSQALLLLVVGFILLTIGVLLGGSFSKWVAFIGLLIIGWNYTMVMIYKDAAQKC